MNPYTNLILLPKSAQEPEMVDKTEQIAECSYDKMNGKMRVRFKAGNKDYPYSCSNVVWYREPKEIPLNQVRLLVDGKVLYNVERVLEFGNYWKVFFAKGGYRTYKREEVQVRKNILNQANSRALMAYYTTIAEKFGLVISGQNQLIEQYRKCNFISEESVLSDFLQGKSCQNVLAKSQVYFPFGCNLSQMKAVQRALDQKISIIEGPPGTGKTQTILNIIANVVGRGGSVAVVSNNNSAIKNVKEKLEKYQYGFLTAELGKRENREEFILSGQTAYPDYVREKYDTQGVAQAKQEAADIENRLIDMFERQNRRAELQQQVADILREQTYFDGYFQENFRQFPIAVNLSRCGSEKLLRAWSILNREGKLMWRDRFVLWRAIGNIRLCFYKGEWKDVILALQHRFYRKKLEELYAELYEIDTVLCGYNQQTELQRLQNVSDHIFKQNLTYRYAGRQERKSFSGDDLWKNPEEFVREYPVVLSTTFSVQKSLSSDYMYDYVIVDEASQVSLDTAVLAMASAKHMVIVGDRMQLPNVITPEIKKEAEMISNSFKIPFPYRYEENSLLAAACQVFARTEITLLREHYRCHPKIIGFCNQKFYRNRLIIMTHDNGEKDVLKAYITVPGNHARGHMNQRQIDEIAQVVLPELEKNNPKPDIGIISPYCSQTEKLQYAIKGYDISTVHKFQGREKDDIIICTVDNEISEFVDNPNMLNVAVSRARKRLRIVLSDNEKNDNTNIGELVRYIRYHNFEVEQSALYSVFDLLYQCYSEQLKKFVNSHKKVSVYDSENIMYNLIEHVLNQDRYAELMVACHFPLNMLIRDYKRLQPEEARYVSNPHTHVDFLIYSRIDKKPLLAIEVDGYQYHKMGTEQWERDRWKNNILEKYNLPLLRFATNGSGERERLEIALQNILAK